MEGCVLASGNTCSECDVRCMLTGASNSVAVIPLVCVPPSCKRHWPRRVVGELVRVGAAGGLGGAILFATRHDMASGMSFRWLGCFERCFVARLVAHQHVCVGQTSLPLHVQSEAAWKGLWPFAYPVAAEMAVQRNFP